MPKQNRVTPFGEIVAYAERGTLMGNRGNLHDNGSTIQRQWNYKMWIACKVEFNGRKRQLMTPGQYTELFFLDEATAFAAGHRPCGECRRADYKRFKTAWETGNQQPNIPIKQLDALLHAERITGSRREGVQITHEAPISALPDGVMIRIQDDACLLWQNQLYRWTPAGYENSQPKPHSGIVTVLTPRSVVAAFAAGYMPQVYGL